MAKVTGALLSGYASGKFSNLVYLAKKKINICRVKKKSKDPKTDKQKFVRSKYSYLVTVWKSFTDEQREYWNSLAVGHGLSGFNLFVKSCYLFEPNAIYGVHYYGACAYN